MAVTRTGRSTGRLAFVSQRDAVPTAVEVVAQWVLERRLPSTGLPLSFVELRPLWRDTANLSSNAARRRRIRRTLAEISRLTAACDLHVAAVLEKAILARMLNDRSVKWLTPTRLWPISVLGQEPFDFSPFTFYLCVAFYNLLCLLNSIRTKQLWDYRRSIAEFLSCAKRRLRAHSNEPLTVGDLLAAHVLLEAADDLGGEFKLAAEEPCKRSAVEYLLTARWKQRVAVTKGLLDWYEKSLRKHLAGLDAAVVFLDDRSAWDDRAASVVAGAITSSAKHASTRRWLAWRLAARIRKGGSHSQGPLALLASMSHSDKPGLAHEFVAQTILEVVTDVALQDAEDFFLRFRRSDGRSSLAPICGWLLFTASQVDLRHRGERDTASCQVWMPLRRSMSRLMRIAIRSGEFGQLFVGEILHEIVASAGDLPLQAISRGLPEMKLYKLCREWFHWSLSAELTRSDNAYIQLVRVLRDTLSGQHRDVERIFRCQKAAWAVATRGSTGPRQANRRLGNNNHGDVARLERR